MRPPSLDRRRHENNRCDTAGKPYFPAGGKAKQLEDRQVPDQPVVFAGDREVGRRLNRRKLRELPHQLLQLGDWNRFVDVCTRLEFVEARFD